MNVFLFALGFISFPFILFALSEISDIIDKRRQERRISKYMKSRKP